MRRFTEFVEMIERGNEGVHVGLAQADHAINQSATMGFGANLTEYCPPDASGRGPC